MDLDYKLDLDLWDCVGRDNPIFRFKKSQRSRSILLHGSRSSGLFLIGKTPFKAELHMKDICGNFRRENSHLINRVFRLKNIIYSSCIDNYCKTADFIVKTQIKTKSALTGKVFANLGLVLPIVKLL